MPVVSEIEAMSLVGVFQRDHTINEKLALTGAKLSESPSDSLCASADVVDDVFLTEFGKDRVSDGCSRRFKRCMA